jgi:pheromone shutdown protein TraB
MRLLLVAWMSASAALVAVGGAAAQSGAATAGGGIDPAALASIFAGLGVMAAYVSRRRRRR